MEIKGRPEARQLQQAQTLWPFTGPLPPKRRKLPLSLSITSDLTKALDSTNTEARTFTMSFAKPEKASAGERTPVTTRAARRERGMTSTGNPSTAKNRSSHGYLNVALEYQAVGAIAASCQLGSHKLTASCSVGARDMVPVPLQPRRP